VVVPQQGASALQDFEKGYNEPIVPTFPENLRAETFSVLSQKMTAILDSLQNLIGICIFDHVPIVW
jgi:hypothetical protein